MRIQKRGSHARTASSHGTATLYLAFINKPISRSLSLSISLSLSRSLTLSTYPSFFLSGHLSVSLSHTHTHTHTRARAHTHHIHSFFCLLLAISLSISRSISISLFLGSNNSNERLNQKEVRSSVPASSHPSLLILDSSLQFASPLLFPLLPSAPHHLTMSHRSIGTLCLNLFAHIVNLSVPSCYLGNQNLVEINTRVSLRTKVNSHSQFFLYLNLLILGNSLLIKELCYYGSKRQAKRQQEKDRKKSVYGVLLWVLSVVYLFDYVL